MRRLKKNTRKGIPKHILDGQSISVNLILTKSCKLIIQRRSMVLQLPAIKPVRSFTPCFRSLSGKRLSVFSLPPWYMFFLAIFNTEAWRGLRRNQTQKALRSTKSRLCAKTVIEKSRRRNYPSARNRGAVAPGLLSWHSIASVVSRQYS
jgi:hypothetical protein